MPPITLQPRQYMEENYDLLEKSEEYKEENPGSVKINGNELTVFKLANYHGRLSQLEHFI